VKIAVTGVTGQVSQSLVDRGFTLGHDIVAIGRPALDLLDPASIMQALAHEKPSVIVSAAAYTAVDKAETESEMAHAINAKGAGAIAEAARALGIPLIHLSTDYVFDGDLDRPYRESDTANPTGVYGASKLAGEKMVLDRYGDNTAILRIAWVYSPFGNNFVKTMLRLAKVRPEIGVVDDQIGNPTSALSIADGILQVAGNLAGNDAPGLRGIFHMTSHGTASWADFAEYIFLQNAALTGSDLPVVRRISTADYPTPARRPKNSQLDCKLIFERHGVALPEWRHAVRVVLERLQLQEI
jgi:dTDP-4-dehydrorhamnose reductase